MILKITTLHELPLASGWGVSVSASKFPQFWIDSSLIFGRSQISHPRLEKLLNLFRELITQLIRQNLWLCHFSGCGWSNHRFMIQAVSGFNGWLTIKLTQFIVSLV